MRRRVIHALSLALGLGLTAPAAANPCLRPPVPDTRIAPDIEYYEMERQRDQMDAYAARMDDYIACLDGEAADARHELDAVMGDWQDTLRRFDSR